MTTNEDKKKCKGGRKKGFLATIAALLLSCSVVLAQNYTAGVTNTDKPDLSMQKAVYRLQIIETNMLAMISGTNPMIITNVMYADMTNLLAWIKTNTAIVDRNVTNIVYVTNAIFGDVTNLLSSINTNTTPAYGTNGTSVVFADGLETNVFMPFTAIGGDGATLPMAVAPMLFDGVGALNRDNGKRSVTNTVSITGTVGVSNITGGVLSVTNPTLATILSALNSLSNRIEQVYDTNTASLGTNGIRTIPAGYVPGNNAINAYLITEALSSTYGGDGTWELLSGVSTNYTSDWIDVSRYKNFTFMICPSAATNHQMFIDATLNSGTNWYNVYSGTITNTNTIMIQWANYKLQKIRGRILTTNETDTLRGFAGN